MPITIAPASWSFRVTVASVVGTQSARIFEPPVVFTPTVWYRSFRLIGMPWSGPRSLPSSSARSAAWACASACSRVIVMNALSGPSRRSARSRIALVSSTGESSRRLSLSPTSRIVR